MAVRLRHSVFLHVPKTGGRWVRHQLLAHVKGAKDVGDPVYDAHVVRATYEPHVPQVPAFAFVRDPVDLAVSLWHHRARKKGSKYGHSFNWQTYVPLERDCGANDFDTWLSNIARSRDAVWSFYRFYVSRAPEVSWGYFENLAEDLVALLSTHGEKFDAKAILDAAERKVGDSNEARRTCPEKIAERIYNSEQKLREHFGYEYGRRHQGLRRI